MPKIWGWTAAVLMLFAGCQGSDSVEQPAGDVDTAAVSTPSTSAETGGYVLFPDDGEILIPCREGSSADARWVIKSDPQNTGSTRLAMGTQALPGGEAIPVHRHEHADEILFIHEGQAMGVLGDSSVSVGPGTTVYVPRGVWHGVENPEDETVNLVWVVSPPGLEGYFRAIGVPPGEDCGPMDAGQMAEIRRQHGITQRME